MTYGGLTHPIYCLTSPLGVYSPYCLGANTCHCVPYCKLTVLPAMWGYACGGQMWANLAAFPSCATYSVGLALQGNQVGFGLAELDSGQ